jgi:hypothetical protein
VVPIWGEGQCQGHHTRRYSLALQQKVACYQTHAAHQPELHLHCLKKLLGEQLVQMSRPKRFPKDLHMFTGACSQIFLVRKQSGPVVASASCLGVLLVCGCVSSDGGPKCRDPDRLHLHDMTNLPYSETQCVRPGCQCKSLPVQTKKESVRIQRRCGVWKHAMTHDDIHTTFLDRDCHPTLTMDCTSATRFCNLGGSQKGRMLQAQPALHQTKAAGIRPQ